MMLSLGFVSGHDFSRAAKEGNRIGLQPLQWHILHEIHRDLWLRTLSKQDGYTYLQRKSAGAKAQIFVGLVRPD
jgi:hypothetical protein